MKILKVFVALHFILFTSIIFAQSNSVEDFLNSLDSKQLEKATMVFSDSSRETWHFLPWTMYERTGIALYDLNESQKALAFNFLKSQLSKTGYLKTRKIIGLENVLAKLSGDPVYRDPKRYYITIYGNPKNDKLWAWSFEGHHISLNFTLLNKKVSASPRFFGTNPAEVKEGPQKGERVLHKEEDLAFELMASMNEKQKSQAIFKANTSRDFITKNKSKVEQIEAVGIKAESLNKKQKNILMSIIDEYLSTIPHNLAKERSRAIKISEFNDIYFGWAGSTEKSKGHYYRIQGDTFLIEFDNTQNNANHVHSVWRDFNGDFGRDLIKEHYQNADHHRNN